MPLADTISLHGEQPIDIGHDDDKRLPFRTSSFRSPSKEEVGFVERRDSDDTAKSSSNANGRQNTLENTSNGGLEESGDNGSTPESAEPASLQNGIDLQAVPEEHELSNGHTAKIESDQEEKSLKLPADKLVELTSAPDSLPLSPISEQPALKDIQDDFVGSRQPRGTPAVSIPLRLRDEMALESPVVGSPSQSPVIRASSSALDRPAMNGRAASTPVMKRKTSSNRTNGIPPLTMPGPKGSRSTSYMDKRGIKSEIKQEPKQIKEEISSPELQPLPMPPLSLPTHLHLELSSSRPSPLYIYRDQADDLPYEPTHVKLERLLNFLLLPPMLEQVLWFGALACFDAWLYTFTILPLRFCKASSILIESWIRNLWTETRYILHYIYSGAGRVWRRRNLVASEPDSVPQTPLSSNTPNGSTSNLKDLANQLRPRPIDYFSRKVRHRRTRSGPSQLLPVDKADILKGLLIIISCYILMYFDASMMYHNIRGQAAIKLYVIYNALEVFDRLLSALGQDVLECLFAKETLDRKPNGRSKLLRPAWLFLLALVYVIVHSLALFYQVITLNVAVNSYSNALLTLLMSNQFVEIKGTVFKKIEKDNLFQMTCADIVERFQLWLMLIIIASRNMVETGGLAGLAGSAAISTADRGPSLLPHSFTLLPEWAGAIMGPFVLVLGTEMLVDWIKHAYITKFNATKPNVYGRYLDVLAKDYYSKAFSDPDLTRRVGLATIPLSCLFIRASVQTYHMFLATHTSVPLPSTTSLDEAFASPETTPAITAAIHHIDELFKRAIFGADSVQIGPILRLPWIETVTVQLPTFDTILTYLATILFFTIIFLLLLILKILLGMALLSYARNRCMSIQKREHASSQAEGKRFGGWGVVELGDERRRRIYEDDPDGLKRMRDRDKDTRDREGRGSKEKGLSHVERYAMVAKRIW